MTFVDTAALYALMDARDPNHASARGALLAMHAAGESLVTHDHVLVESVALIQRRLGMDALRRFVDDLLPVIEVAWVDATLHGEAREALLAAGRRDLSLVDWTSFLLMRRHGIRRAFTFDADFVAQGFDVVPPAADGAHRVREA